jgi:hypothetical protein
MQRDVKKVHSRRAKSRQISLRLDRPDEDNETRQGDQIPAVDRYTKLADLVQI